MTESFFQSEMVTEDLEDIQETYTELLKMSAGLSDFSPQERLDHIEKTLELVAKQKIFYARLALASHEVTGDEAKEAKARIDFMAEQHSGGLNLLMILDQMETKLQTWRKELQTPKKD